MTAVTLTKHAVKRMRERDITTHDVIRALAFGEPSPTRQPAVYRSRISGSRGSGEPQQICRVGDVVVVYRQGDGSDEHQVVTAYRREPARRAVRR